MKKTIYILAGAFFALSAFIATPSVADAASASLRVYRPVVSIEASGSSRVAANGLVVANVGKGAAESVIVHDILRDPEGDLVRDEVWDLGTIEPGEIVEFSYDISFADDAAAGAYTLTAKVTGKNVAKAAVDAKGVIHVGGVEREEREVAQDRSLLKRLLARTVYAAQD